MTHIRTLRCFSVELLTKLSVGCPEQDSLLARQSPVLHDKHVLRVLLDQAMLLYVRLASSRAHVVTPIVSYLKGRMNDEGKRV
jgi:hypothetical protein